MTRNSQRLGALLLGIGLGILIFRLFPILTWLWPFGLVMGGIMIWRKIGVPIVQVVLVVLSLTIALLATPAFLYFPLGQPGRVVATYQQSVMQQRAWQELKRVVIINSVGDITVEGGSLETEVAVEYRRSQRSGRIPGELQVAYDERRQTLTVTGTDPDLSQSAQRGLSANITLRVPEWVRVHVTNELGNVNVSRLQHVDIHADVGRIRVYEVDGSLNAQSDVGSIDIENTAAEIIAATRVGELKLTFDQPLNHPLRARTEVGDIQLILPSTSNTTVRAISQIRNLSGDLEQITASEGRLRLGTGEHEAELFTRVGEVRVKQR